LKKIIITKISIVFKIKFTISKKGDEKICSKNVFLTDKSVFRPETFNQKSFFEKKIEIKLEMTTSSKIVSCQLKEMFPLNLSSLYLSLSLSLSLSLLLHLSPFFSPTTFHSLISPLY